LIKQDIVHQVIERTGLPRTKAEAAVDTVFEGLKQALPPASASNCADLAFSASAPAKPASAATPHRHRSQHHSGKSGALQTGQGTAFTGQRCSAAQLKRLPARQIQSQSSEPVWADWIDAQPDARPELWIVTGSFRTRRGRIPQPAKGSKRGIRCVLTSGSMGFH